MIELTLHNRIRYAVRKLGANNVLPGLAALGYQIAPDSEYITYFDNLGVPRFLSQKENYLLEIKCRS